jgi:hypothetical protein
MNLRSDSQGLGISYYVYLLSLSITNIIIIATLPVRYSSILIRYLNEVDKLEYYLVVLCRFNDCVRRTNLNLFVPNLTFSPYSLGSKEQLPRS